MISGLLVDIVVIGATVAFAWAGLQLGGIASTVRCIGVVLSFVFAMLLRDPLGNVIHDLTGKGTEFARATAMFAVAMMSYGAVEKILGWAQYRLREDQDDWFEEAGLEDTLIGPLETPTAAAISGGILGFGWGLLFIAMLVLVPRDSVFSRAAINSFTGRVLIAQQGGLEWIVDGFPHYAQTLPKGDLGAVAGEQGRLPMRGEIEPKPRTSDASVLLRGLNRARAGAEEQTLVWNPELAGVAQRQAEALAASKLLTKDIPGGGSLDGQAISALGSAAADFEDEPGVLLSWAHAPANAAAALVEDPTSSKRLRRGEWSEAGIGVADAGWFNGRIYVVLLVAAKRAQDEFNGDPAAVAGF